MSLARRSGLERRIDQRGNLLVARAARPARLQRIVQAGDTGFSIARPPNGHGGSADAEPTPSSTNNESKRRDPEMRQAKKHGQCYFGMKVHVGASKQGLVHSLATGRAGEADITRLDELLHGGESRESNRYALSTPYWEVRLNRSTYAFWSGSAEMTSRILLVPIR